MLRSLSVITVVLALAAQARAQDLDVPIQVFRDDGRAADCATHLVADLKADGDGFLAVRTGPGTGFRKVDELHNGAVVFSCEIRGKWRGVIYRKEGSGPADSQGWVHSNWLRTLSG